MDAAAFFDLDRTLLPGGSGPLITRALSRQGLVPAWQARLSDITFAAYGRLGETRLTMELTKRAVQRSKGWPRDKVAAAATEAAGEVADRLYPRMVSIMEAHRRDGRRVVIATTTAVDLVAPVAERLGAELVATEWQADGDTYTGELLGSFVWGVEKLEAVRRWCDAEGIDLAQSWAYSDSLYDLPLLEAAGYPTAVNPDARLRILAAVRRWPVLDPGQPDGGVHLAGLDALDLAGPLLRPEFFPFARWRFEGAIPTHGPVLIRAPFTSPLDPLALSLAAARSRRKLRFVTGSGPAAALHRLAGSLPSDRVAAAIDNGEAIALFDGDGARFAAPRVEAEIDGSAGLWAGGSRLPRPRFGRRPTITVRLS